MKTWASFWREAVGVLALIVVLLVVFVVADAARDRWGVVSVADDAREVWMLEVVSPDEISVKISTMYSGERGLAVAKQNGQCIPNVTDCMPNGYFMDEQERRTYAQADLASVNMIVLRNSSSGFIDNQIVNDPVRETMRFTEFLEMRERCLEEMEQETEGVTFTGGDASYYPSYEYCGGFAFTPTYRDGQLVALEYLYLP